MELPLKIKRTRWYWGKIHDSFVIVKEKKKKKGFSLLLKVSQTLNLQIYRDKGFENMLWLQVINGVVKLLEKKEKKKGTTWRFKTGHGSQRRFRCVTQNWHWISQEWTVFIVDLLNKDNKTQIFTGFFRNRNMYREKKVVLHMVYNHTADKTQNGTAMSPTKQ